MATTDGDEFLQEILDVSEQVGTIFANHVPRREYDRIAESLVALANRFADQPDTRPVRMVIAGALAAVGHEAG
jgi:hypothetical protein